MTAASQFRRARLLIALQATEISSQKRNILLLRVAHIVFMPALRNAITAFCRLGAQSTVMNQQHLQNLVRSFLLNRHPGHATRHATTRGRVKPLVLPTLGLTLCILAITSGCQGSGAQKATATVVGKAMELGKGTATGFSDGLRDGRKESESVDGALVVSSWKEFSVQGTASVFAIEPAGEAAKVVLAIENKGETPLRVAELRIIALDRDGFLLLPQKGADRRTLTVPPRSKIRYTVRFGVAPERLDHVRLWEHDLAPLSNP